MPKWFLILLLIITSNVVSAQSGDYHKLIKSNNPGFKIFHDSKNDSSRWEYLGTIKSPSGKTVYYVITEFTQFKAANVFHGNSRLLFFDKKERLRYVYNIGVPDKLPSKLLDNKLYFRSQNKKTDIVMINSNLPKMLCAFDCYDLEIK